MSRYQNVENFNRGNLYGSPQYLGQEYDKEVPDNILIGSPGGTASTFSHWTKGFYGEPSSSWDIYAGQGRAYEYGIKGGLYDYGQTAIYDMGYYNQPPDPIYTGNDSVPVQDVSGRENFTLDTDKIDVTNVDDLLKDNGNNNCKKVQIKINPVILFVLFIIAYIAMDFWSSSGQLFLQERFNKGEPLSWKTLLIMAIASSVILFGVTWSLNVPIVEFETL